MNALISRRAAMQYLAFAGSTLLAGATVCSAQPAPPVTGLGLVTYCCGLRRSALRKESPDHDLFAPQQFLQHCRALGAGGMQLALGVMVAEESRALRAAAEAAGQYIEAIISVPKNAADGERFDAEMQTAASAGALAVRTTIIPGRRYEYFDSLEMFREYEARGRRALELAAPIAERLRLPIAVENHKDQRDDERVELLKVISSEFVGACVDTGNSFALLEDPLETVRKLAPWAHSVHLKDQAVQPYEDGFLLGDIPLGQGCLDLKSMVAVLRDTRPHVKFSLELITRDPLQVPVLLPKYWATFPDLPAKDLARTMRYVRDHSADQLQMVSRLDAQQQVALEDANVRASLDYARRELKL